MVVSARGSFNKRDGQGYVNARHNRDQPTNGLKYITEWKQLAIEKILQDETLVKLLHYPIENWNEQSDLNQEQIDALMYKNIFPYRFVSEIAEKQQSYISIDVANFVPLEEFRLFSNKYIHGYLYFHIMCDIGIMRTHSGVRSDLIAGRIYELFQLSTGIGMGTLEMETTLPLWTDNNHFGGYTIGFKLSEMV